MRLAALTAAAMLAAAGAAAQSSRGLPLCRQLFLAGMG
jgi:hypothetical protein